jgi:hypothetical protein
LRGWCEDAAEVLATVSEGVQIGSVTVLREVFAMVSEGVQSGGGSDPDLKSEGEGRSSYCRSVAIVWVISKKGGWAARHSSDFEEVRMGEVKKRLVKSSGLASRASLITTSKAKSERQESARLLQDAVIRNQDTSKDNILVTFNLSSANLE